MHLFAIQGTLAVVIALIVFSVHINLGDKKAIKYAVASPIALFVSLLIITYLTKEQSTSPGRVTLFFAVGIAMWLLGSIIGLILGYIFTHLKNKKPNKAINADTKPHA